MAIEVFKLQIEGFANAQYTNMGLYFGADTGGDSAFFSAQDLIAAFTAHAEANFLACLPDTYYLSRYVAARKIAARGPNYHKQYQTQQKLGTGGSSFTGNQLCPCLTFIPPTGSTTVGRCFMPAVFDGAYTNNQPTAGYKTALDTFVAPLLTGIMSSTINWKVQCYQRKPPPGASHDAMQYKISTVIGFQGRRRKPI